MLSCLCAAAQDGLLKLFHTKAVLKLFVDAIDLQCFFVCVGGLVPLALHLADVGDRKIVVGKSGVGIELGGFFVALHGLVIAALFDANITEETPCVKTFRFFPLMVEEPTNCSLCIEYGDQEAIR